jgi:DNA-binding transcriptional LysR family regulator
MNLTFRHFEIVSAVAEARSVSRAASVLGLTQSAVTHALQTLEDQIGAELFVRSPKGLEPTDAANVFLRRNSNIQSSLDGILNDIERIRRLETGKLTIAASIWPSANSVEVAVARFSLLYPQLSIDLVHDNWRLITDRILIGEIDLGVIELENAAIHAEMETELLNSEQAYFFTKTDHPVLKLTNPTVGPAWTQRNANLFEKLGGGFGQFDADTGLLGPQIAGRTFGATRNIVLYSDAIGYCVPGCIADDLASRRLVLLKMPIIPSLRANYGFAWLKKRVHSPSTLAFMDMVRVIEAEKRSTVDN